MSDTAIKGIMDVTMDKIRAMADADTIIGREIKLDNGIVIIPVSKVSFGFASGGSDFPSKSNRELFGGGGGAGRYPKSQMRRTKRSVCCLSCSTR